MRGNDLIKFILDRGWGTHEFVFQQEGEGVPVWHEIETIDLVPGKNIVIVNPTPETVRADNMFVEGVGSVPVAKGMALIADAEAGFRRDRG